MFENILEQDAKKTISSDIRNNNFPGAVLFSGPEASGKLSAALETARVFSCKNEKKGSWLCECSACLKNKALTYSNILLLGPRDCLLEIIAGKEYFLNAVQTNAPYIVAARYFFVRSIRKLTLRFNGILLQGDNNLNKIGALVEEINENLEALDIYHSLPAYEDIENTCNTLEALCKKLEGEYLWDSIPVNQIRNMEEWAHIKSEEGRKTIIIENADRMQASVRNALLKILEEPPADCIFILTTSKRNAIMQTILSRVRTYNFRDRSFEQQQNVIHKIFHNESYSGTINDYLLTFLPVPPVEIKAQAELFISTIANRKIPDVNSIVKKCGNFNPRIELKLFLNYIALYQKKMLNTPAGCEVSAKTMTLLRQCWDNITLYNQTPVSALEILLRDLSSLNVQNNGVMKICNESVL